MASKHVTRSIRGSTIFLGNTAGSSIRQINKTFIQGLLTRQDQEFFKSLHKPKRRKQYRKITLLVSNKNSTSSLAVSFHHPWVAILDVFENFRSRPIGNSFLVFLGCLYDQDANRGSTSTFRDVRVKNIVTVFSA